MSLRIIVSSFQMLLFAAVIVLLAPLTLRAETCEYHLEISSGDVNITGRPTTAMTINGTVPGPELRCREGDVARFHVRNRMAVETSIHWHGILLPPEMDGVPYVSFPPIAPGAAFTYEFPVRQSGTYWYHSHTGLQEQRGVYGAIVIEPPVARFPVDRDYAVLLSDWADEDPHQILRLLKRGSEWYALEKGSAQSILGAARVGLLGDYFKRELQRMPAMDIADVAYDRFLANGRPEIRLAALPGETVRLRIIDGSSTTFFHLESAAGPMRIIAADGIDVEPFAESRFLIGVAETYDVLLRIPASGSYELRATAHDGSGFASVWLGDGVAHPAPDIPRPNLYQSMGDLSLSSVFALNPASAMGMGDDAVAAGMFDAPGMAGMSGMEHDMGHGTGHPAEDAGDVPKTPHDAAAHGENHGASDSQAGYDMAGHEMQGHESMEMADMSHSAKKHAAHPVAQSKEMSINPALRDGKRYGADFRFMAADVSSSGNLAMEGMGQRPWPPYEKLRAIQPTAFDSGKPVREIRLTLDGDMERYVWFLNNMALAETDVIPINQGEIVRFIMINRTMMHHPMHLHGHFFRVVNGQGDHAPLKHTVDVAPMSTTVIEFAANEVGDWFFHCHLLYHMESGMARLIHYENYEMPADVAPIRPQLYSDMWHFWGEAEVASNMTEGFLKAADTRNTLAIQWEAGWQRVDENEWEGVFFWDRYLNGYFSLFAGLDMWGADSDTEHARGVAGVSWMMPLLIESRWWLDTDGGGRFSFEKSFSLTPRLGLTGEAQYDTHDSQWEGRASLAYTLTKNISLVGGWHSDYGWGGGAIIRF